MLLVLVHAQVWFQNRRAKWRRTQKANQLAMAELGKGMIHMHPGVHHPALGPHGAYMHTMPGTMGPHTFAPPNLSPGSTVLMTPKSAGIPPSHQQLMSKQPFVLHHPTASAPPSLHNGTPTSLHTPYCQSQSAPWSSHSQFVFPSPTAMTFTHQTALPTSSPICSTPAHTIPTPW